MKNRHVNAVVVGAGAGGGVIAKELAVNGFSVVVFERGEWPSYDANPTDELISQRIQELGNAFGPNWTDHPRVFIHRDGRRDTITPSDGRYHHNAACVGSGTVSYGAQAWRYMPQDFRLKSVYGDVEGSSLEDWPITYDDLEPYYTRAEWEIGVSGDDSCNPFAGPRSRPYPMPSFEYNSEANHLYPILKRMGLHPFPLPMLRNSVAYNGRAACIRNHACCGYACPVDAKNGTQNTVLPTAIATGNCRVRTSCIVAEVTVNDHGRATGVKYFDDRGRARIQTADIVVVAASAIETARLLLNSRSKLHPDGTGNNHDQVGRNLQGHVYTGATGLFDFEIQDLKGPGATLAISDYNHGNPGIVGGGMLATEFFLLPYGFSRTRPPGFSRWGKAHKEFQRQNFYRMGRMIGPIQEMPVNESRVTIDRSVRDYRGIPVAALSGRLHPLEHTHASFLADRAAEIMREAGARKVWKGWVPSEEHYIPSGGQHQMGTCRMGTDPKRSVTDPFCKVHGTDNLFVGDGSVLVTGGGFNPVLTIMAVAYRTADHIVRGFGHLVKG